MLANRQLHQLGMVLDPFWADQSDRNGHMFYCYLLKGFVSFKK